MKVGHKYEYLFFIKKGGGGCGSGAYNAKSMWLNTKLHQLKTYTRQKVNGIFVLVCFRLIIPNITLFF